MYFPLSIHGKQRHGGGNRTPMATRVLERSILAPLASEQMEGRDTIGGAVGFMARCYFDGRPRGDWDNLGKLVADALNGITYYDDRQITYGSVEILQSDEPGVSLTLVELKNEFKIHGVPR
jgi:Holliday junction resolvase RusA-like endonuclease